MHESYEPTTSKSQSNTNFLRNNHMDPNQLLSPLQPMVWQHGVDMEKYNPHNNANIKTHKNNSCM